MDLPWKSTSFSCRLTPQPSLCPRTQDWGRAHPLPPQQRKELRGRPGQPGRDEEGVRDWGAQGTASGAGELVLVPVQVECVQMFRDRGWGWSRDKPRLVLMNSAGRHSNWTTSMIPSNPKVLAPLGGQGGNGGREKTESGGTRASSWLRHGVGKRQGHSFAFPRRWVL